MVLHARGEGVPCSSYSTSHVGHDQSRLMENLSNRLSHHRHLLLCCPSSLPFFSRIFLSVQIGSGAMRWMTSPLPTNPKEGSEDCNHIVISQRALLYRYLSHQSGCSF